MTPDLQLHIKLKSDATFGRGEGTPGEVDTEVEYDAFGLPFFGGRALKGALVQECADLLYALGQCEGDRWWKAAETLFGRPGSTSDTAGALVVGDAQLPERLRQAVASAVTNAGLLPHQVLASLTSVRRQTANDVQTGAPLDKTLRAMRVVLRETDFLANLRFRMQVNDDCLAFLAACTAALRRLGTGRSRGRGEVECWLTDAEDKPVEYLGHFIREVEKA